MFLFMYPFPCSFCFLSCAILNASSRVSPSDLNTLPRDLRVSFIVSPWITGSEIGSGVGISFYFFLFLLPFFLPFFLHFFQYRVHSLQWEGELLVFQCSYQSFHQPHLLISSQSVEVYLNLLNLFD